MNRINDIGGLLENAEKITATLRKASVNGRLCAIEKDILLERLRGLYDHIQFAEFPDCPEKPASETAPIAPPPRGDGSANVKLYAVPPVPDPVIPETDAVAGGCAAVAEEAAPKFYDEMEAPATTVAEIPAAKGAEPKKTKEYTASPAQPVTEPEIPFSYQQPLNRSVIDALYGDETLVKKQPEPAAETTPEPPEPDLEEKKVVVTDVRPDPETSHTLNEILATDTPSNGRVLNEAMGERQVADVASVLSSRSVSELRKSIGLNDKFLLLNDVFDRDTAIYEAALEKLDSFDTIEDAYIFLQEHFVLDPSREGAQLLIELLERKFS